MSKHKIQGTVETGTFGGSKAAKNLAIILDELKDEKLAKLVGRFWSSYSSPMRSIAHIPNSKHAAAIANLWYREHREEAEDFSYLNKAVFTHLVNMMKAVYRETLISCGAATPAQMTSWMKLKEESRK